jgi:hypothetical protein
VLAGNSEASFATISTVGKKQTSFILYRKASKVRQRWI